jgi:hypothetical protein
MHPDDTRDTADRIEEPPATPPEGAPGPAQPLGAAVGDGWNRRKFLAAAALGTAAAALVNRVDGGLQFGPLAALANDLSHLPCTAQDVEIIGAGVVTSGFCSCPADGTGTFTATVTFTVRNNTGTDRYCPTVHLPNGTDIVLTGEFGSRVPPGTHLMSGTISGLPCNAAGTICFGSPGVTRGKCDPGTCATLAWNVSAGAACPDPTPPGGQCRHQQICIRIFGVTLDCNPTAAGVQTTCSVPCGGTATLTATAAGIDPIASGTPLTYTLRVGTTVVASSGPTNQTNYTFTNVAVTAPSTTFTVTLCDTRVPECCRTATVTVTTEAVTAALAASTPGCNGRITFTASTTGTGSCTYRFAVDGVFQGAASATNTFTYDPCALGTLDGACHTVRVDVVCGSCTASASRRVTQCVTTSVNAAGACP